MSEKFQPQKGTRDLMPEEMIKRQYIIDKIRQVFEIFGFLPIETPAIESWEILSTKGVGGSEILEEAYKFEDRSGRDIGLRYDLTVPLARVIANNPNIPLPFKRYQIEKVWRYGDVSKGRLREFLQADIDIVGTESMLADAEVIACAVMALEKLNIKHVIRINNRKILSGIMRYAGIKQEKSLEVLRTIDKLEKIGEENVKKELIKNISEASIKKIFDFIKSDNKPEKILEKVKPIAEEGVEELEEIVSYLREMNVKKFKIDLSLARGLDYYTGPIFEISAFEESTKSAKLGSIAGGGRYDKLIGMFLKKDIPATGISLGIERIIEIIDVKKEKMKVFVANAEKGLINKSIEIAQKLRAYGIASDFDLRNRSLSKQLEYVNSLGIPFVVIVGKREIEKDEVTLRNMNTGEEKRIKIEEVKSIVSEDFECDTRQAI